MSKKFGFICSSLLMTATLIFTSCGGGKRYTIEGNVDSRDFDSLYVYLYDYNAEIIDSTMVLQGHFIFEGEVETPELINFVCPYGSELMALEPGHTQLVIEQSGIAEYGTPCNDEINLLKTTITDYGTEATEKLNQLAAIANDTMDVETLVMEINRSFVEQINKVLDSTYSANKDNLAGLYVFLLKLWNVQDPAEAEAMVAEASPLCQESPYVVQYLDYLQQMQGGGVAGLSGVDDNQMFIDFEGTDAEGKSMKLSDYVGRGKPVLVDFWASWCGPCRAETPYVKAIHEKFGDKVIVLGVAISDEVKNHLAAVNELGITWPQIIDSGAEAAEAYNIQAIPFIILFAPDGTVYRQNLRGEQLEAAVLEVLE